MTWPRGRYNGRRIAGVDIHFRLNVLWWNWKPLIGSGFGGFMVHWLCFHMWFNAEYDQ